MTNEKALKLAQESKKSGSHILDENRFDFLDTCINALTLQIPQHPWKQATDDTCLYYEYRCPSCDHSFGYMCVRGRRVSYCPECGQAINWGDGR